MPFLTSIAREHFYILTVTEKASVIGNCMPISGAPVLRQILGKENIIESVSLLRNSLPGSLCPDSRGRTNAAATGRRAEEPRGRHGRHKRKSLRPHERRTG